MIGAAIRVHLIASYASALTTVGFFVHHMLSEHLSFSFHVFWLEAALVVVYPLFIFYVFSVCFPVQNATSSALVSSAVYFVVAAVIIGRGRDRGIDGSVEN